MILKTGDMWSTFNNAEDMFMITTNATTKTGDELVMGRGIARVMRDSFPGSAELFGKAISNNPDYRVMTFYYKEHHLGIFRVKDHWSGPASTILISEAVGRLIQIANGFGGIINLNYPGIGNGRLSVKDVAPLIKPLPDNVHVWSFG